MRFRITAKLEGDGVSREPFEVSLGELRVGITVDADSAVTGIWADLPVPDHHRWMPRVIIGAGNVEKPHQISFDEPPQAESLVDTLQYVESLGSFWLGIHRIHWSEAKREWIAESDEEKGQLSVFSVAHSMSYDRRPVPFRAAILRELLQRVDAKRWLVIPMSFLREGTNDYEAHRYINAFYNFYFFLEDLFGNGKTKNRQVIAMFTSSAELKAAALKAYGECCTSQGKKESLERLMKAVGGDATEKGLMRFLVMMRGELHHFSRRSSRPKGHPLNQAEFQPLAFFAMAICLNVLPRLITDAKHGREG